MTEQPVPPPTRLRIALGWILKLGLVAAIFAYLIHKDSIKLESVREFTRNWRWALVAVGLNCLSVLVCTLRYKILLQALHISVRYTQLLPINLIGMFFDLVSPVSNGGDIVKTFYVRRAAVSPEGKPPIGVLLLSVLLDRIVGFLGLFLLGLGFSIVAWPQISTQENLRRVTLLIACTCVGVLGGFFVMVSERLEKSPLRKRLMHIIPFHEKIESLYAGFAGLRHHKRNLLAMVGLSICNQVFVCVIVLVLGQGMRFESVADGSLVPLPLLPCLTVLPIGMTLNTFGVAGGVGVGNLAFDILFQSVLGLKGGAGLILNYQLLGILFRLSGMPFLLLYRHREGPPPKVVS